MTPRQAAYPFRPPVPLERGTAPQAPRPGSESRSARGSIVKCMRSIAEGSLHPRPSTSWSRSSQRHFRMEELTVPLCDSLRKTEILFPYRRPQSPCYNNGLAQLVKFSQGRESQARNSAKKVFFTFFYSLFAGRWTQATGGINRVCWHWIEIWPVQLTHSSVVGPDAFQRRLLPSTSWMWSSRPWEADYTKSWRRHDATIPE